MKEQSVVAVAMGQLPDVDQRFETSFRALSVGNDNDERKAYHVHKQVVRDVNDFIDVSLKWKDGGVVKFNRGRKAGTASTQKKPRVPCRSRQHTTLYTYRSINTTIHTYFCNNAYSYII